MDMERVARIELALSAWKAGVIPLYDTRVGGDISRLICIVNGEAWGNSKWQAVEVEVAAGQDNADFLS